VKFRIHPTLLLIYLLVLALTSDTSAYAASQVDPAYSAAVHPLVQPSDLPPVKRKSDPRSLAQNMTAQNMTQDQINTAFDNCFTGAQNAATACDLGALAACASPGGPAAGAGVCLACVAKYISDITACRDKYPTAQPSDQQASDLEDIGLK
jgi:hypothetical protein